jgi:hypothetical protein
MQGGVREWVLRAARGGGRGLRVLAPSVLLSLLCAGAFSPLLAVAAGVASAAGVAGIGVLASVGGGVLAEVLTRALDQLREHGGGRPSRDELEERIALEIQGILAAGDRRAGELRAEIAGVLREIDAGGTALRAAVEAGDERMLREVVGAMAELGSGFAELGFLVGDVKEAAARIQESLDEQGADVRQVIEQNNRQSAEIGLALGLLAVIEERTRDGVVVGPAGGGRGPRWVAGMPISRAAALRTRPRGGVLRAGAADG